MDLLRNRLMAAVTGKKSILPEGFTQVEYLHIWGTTYIDMGIAPREQRDHIEIDLQFVGSVANVFIGYPSTDNASYIRTSNATPSTCQGRNSGSLYTVPTFRFDNSRHIIGIDGHTTKRVYADSYHVNIPSSNNNFANNNYRIGGRRSTSVTAFDGNIFAARYWRDGALVRNVIPCRDADGKGYAYDSATKSFRTISGSNVEPGPDVV